MRTGPLRPNLAAVIVLVAVPVALVGVVGDLPDRPFTPPPPSGELTFHEDPHLAIGAPKPKQLADVDFLDTPQIKVGTILPIKPHGHAVLIGTIKFNGVKRSPGPLDLVVRLPGGSTLAPSEDYEGERDNEADVRPLESYPGASEWRVSFKTREPCEDFFGVVGFTIKSAVLAYAQGWGRQRIKVSYHKPWAYEHAIEAVDDDVAEQCKHHSAGIEAPAALVLSMSRGHQRVAELAASPDETRGVYRWVLPRGEADSLTVEATIENARIRYFADLAPELLFLAIGALLGTISLRGGRPSRSTGQP